MRARIHILLNWISVKCINRIINILYNLYKLSFYHVDTIDFTSWYRLYFGEILQSDGLLNLIIVEIYNFNHCKCTTCHLLSVINYLYLIVVYIKVVFCVNSFSIYDSLFPCKYGVPQSVFKFWDNESWCVRYSIHVRLILIAFSS